MMSKIACIVRYSVCALALALCSGFTAFAKDCELDNAALRAMPKVAVHFELEGGESHIVQAKLADNNMTRAAGFQRVCASVIAAEPILFVFQQPRQPSFHMHNVVAPIDIVFIREDGTQDSSHAMQPYSLISVNKPLYSSSGAVIAALETEPAYFETHGISAAAHIRWEILQSDATD